MRKTYKYYLLWMEASNGGPMMDTKLFAAWLEANHGIILTLQSLYSHRSLMREYGLMLYTPKGQPYLKPLD